MNCQESLNRALTQIHSALIACSECILETQTDDERRSLQEMCELLATQSKRLHDTLLNHCNQSEL